MSFSSSRTGGGLPTKSDINTTPLVDVMLVLLIIFMITAPLMSHKIGVKLPQPNPNPTENKNDPIRLTITDSGGITQIYLDDEITDMQGLLIAFREEGKKGEDEQAEFKILADDTVPYQLMTEIMAGARRSQVEKLGFAELFKPGDRTMQ